MEAEGEEERRETDGTCPPQITLSGRDPMRGMGNCRGWVVRGALWVAEVGWSPDLCTQRQAVAPRGEAWGARGGGGHRGYSNFNNMPRTLLVSDKAGFRAGEAAGTPAGEAKRWPARGGH